MASQGPNLAGTGADDSSNGGIAAWKTPGKITAEDGTTASALLRDLQVSHWLKASRFGFTIPVGSTINGIKVEVKKADSLGVSSDSDVRIMKGGVVGGTQEANVNTGWPTALTWITYGSATDLWSLAWTPADINALNFGVVVAGISDTGLPRPPDGHPAVDAIRVTIFYTPPHWGVDSTTHADNVGPTYPPGQKFFDLVTTQAGGNQPEFWGRYIGSTPHTEYNLTLGEVPYLSSRNCKILLIYNGHTNLSVSSTSDGQIAATTAITSARQVAAPEDGTVWLYCDIEPGQSPTRAFFTAWFQTVQSTSGYGAGVYGTTSPAFNTEYCPAYNSAATPPEYLYNTQPRHTGCDMTYRVFNPTIPACNPPTNPPTVIQQYDIGPTIYGCPVNNAGSTEGVDLDLADDKGFASMWAPKRWLFACWFRTTAGSSYGVGPIGSMSKDNGKTWSVPAVMTGSPSDPVNTAVWDQYGGCVCRGSGSKGVLDLYATAPTNIQQSATWVGFYIKRYTFDGTAWTGPVRVVDRSGLTNMKGVLNPKPFRNFSGTKRALTWLEQRTSSLTGDGGSKSHTVTWSWVNVGSVTINGVTYTKWQLTQNPQDTLDYFGSARNQVPTNSWFNSVSITASTTYGGGDSPTIIWSVTDDGHGGVCECSGSLSTFAQAASGNTVFASGTSNYSGSDGSGIGTSGIANLSGSTTLNAGACPCNSNFLGGAFPGWGTAYTRVPAGSPPTPASATVSTTITNVAITLLVVYLFYCDLDSNGNLSGTPVTVFDNVKHGNTVTGRFDSSDNPVLAVIETDVTPNVGSRIVRTGSTWGTPMTFLLSDDTDIDAQLLGTPSFKAILSNSLLGDHGAFVALNQHATYSHVYDRRVRNFPGQANVTDSIDLLTIAQPPDPSVPQTRYWPMFESQLIAGGAGDLAAFVFNTDNSPGTRADVWALIGQNNGSNWYAYHIAEDDLLGNFYDRSMDWVSA